MVKNARSPLKRGLWIAFLIVLIGAVVVTVMNRQQIKDHFSAVAFEPSARVSEVLTSLRLSESGERVFLATHPTIDGSQHFNEQCAEVDHSEQGHVLGCFTHDRIHLFDVSDDRVTGIVEVTAAHELLHATFARLGEGDRAALSAKLRQEYDELAEENPELKERMSVYEHLSDTAFANELHSVLGTEVRELPGWLERHYEQWFKDRGAIVDGFASYHAVFVDLQQQAEDIRAEMTTLRADVEQRKIDYGAAVDQFNADAAEFSARNERFEFSDSPDEFERVRADLEWRRGELEVTLEQLQADIDRYNALRDQLTALSEVSSELDQQLNSDLAPVTTRPTE
ncbi:hypothetical protein [Leucobacter luti]|uniref:Uncharacterized protein n=1 Tax=Leucobacter luti TaxID=340320 RepID=A0A4V2FN97_9MICO|nr:hypothetical protein [Leucobacter luti]MBL3700351.1 hypothetical protein [Leucobacter luti]RZT60519.1 hypothetical protein EV139_2961 [Leucobacter luti]